MSAEPTNVAADEEGLYCPGCGYDLRMTEAGRCPECGREFDKRALAVSRIPWVHRRELGRVKAWWRTVWMVLRRPGEVGAEVARPVGWGDAKRFSWVTCAVAAAMVGVATAAMYPWMDVQNNFRVGIDVWSMYLPGAWMRPTLYPVFALLTGPGLIAVLVIGTFLGALAAIWWVRLWFWMLGGDRRDRASAVACYAGAWSPVFGLVAAADIGVWVAFAQGVFLFRLGDFPWLIVLMQALLGTLVAVQTLWFLQRSTRRGWMMMFVAGVGIPVGALSLFACCLYAINYLLGLAALALWSVWS